MRFILLALFALVILQCSDDKGEPSFAYLLTPDGFLNPVELENDDNPDPKKYTLSWKNPTKTDGFLGNAIYLDTTNWNAIVKDSNDREGAMLWMPVENRNNEPVYKESETIIFSLGIVPGGGD